MLPVSKSLENLGDVKHFAHSQKLLESLSHPEERQELALPTKGPSESGVMRLYCPSLLETTGIFAFAVWSVAAPLLVEILYP